MVLADWLGQDLSMLFLGVCKYLSSPQIFVLTKKKTTTPKEKTRKKKKQETCPIFRIL
jgi:hypothetical protein